MQTPKFRWLTSTQGIFHPCLSISTWRAERAVQALLYIQACYYQQNLHFVDTGCGSWWVGCRKITSLDQNKTHQQISHRLQNNSCKHQYQVELKTNTQGKQRVCKHFPCPEHLALVISHPFWKKKIQSLVGELRHMVNCVMYYITSEYGLIEHTQFKGHWLLSCSFSYLIFF